MDKLTACRNWTHLCQTILSVLFSSLWICLLLSLRFVRVLFVDVVCLLKKWSAAWALCYKGKLAHPCKSLCSLSFRLKLNGNKRDGVSGSGPFRALKKHFPTLCRFLFRCSLLLFSGWTTVGSSSRAFESAQRFCCKWWTTTRRVLTYCSHKVLRRLKSRRRLDRSGLLPVCLRPNVVQRLASAVLFMLSLFS